MWIEDIQWIEGWIFQKYFKLPRPFQFIVIDGLYFNYISRKIVLVICGFVMLLCEKVEMINNIIIPNIKSEIQLFVLQLQ